MRLRTSINIIFEYCLNYYISVIWFATDCSGFSENTAQALLSDDNTFYTSHIYDILEWQLQYISINEMSVSKVSSKETSTIYFPLSKHSIQFFLSLKLKVII